MASIRGRLSSVSNASGPALASPLLVAEQVVPRLELTSTEVRFGAVLVGEERAVTLGLKPWRDGPISLVDMRLAEDSAPSFALGRRDGGVPDTPLVIQADGGLDVVVRFAPDSAAESTELGSLTSRDEATVLVRAEGDDFPTRVSLSGFGVTSTYSVPILTVPDGTDLAPGTEIGLSGEQSYSPNGEVVAWRRDVAQPAGSIGGFSPSAQAAEPTFSPLVFAAYTFRLDVVDERGNPSCEPAYRMVEVCPADAIHVELYWRTPGDPDELDEGPFVGSDLDLHLLHPDAPSRSRAPDLDGDGAPDPYFDSVLDCHSRNPRPDWGEPGESRDDPQLSRDDTDGFGPELVRLGAREEGARCRVAVHYYNANGFGAASATVCVFLHGEMAWEMADVTLAPHDLWCAAFVEKGEGRVVDCLDESGDPLITFDCSPLQLRGGATPRGEGGTGSARLGLGSGLGFGVPDDEYEKNREDGGPAPEPEGTREIVGGLAVRHDGLASTALCGSTGRTSSAKGRRRIPTATATHASSRTSSGATGARIRRPEAGRLVRGNCGQLSRGFARLRCPSCGEERHVAFSCKGRLCPSCWSRRAADTAADLVDRVLPVAPYRQWVLTLPWELPYHLATDRELLAKMLRGLLQVLFSWQRERGRRAGIAQKP